MAHAVPYLLEQDICSGLLLWWPMLLPKDEPLTMLKLININWTLLHFQDGITESELKGKKKNPKPY